MAIGIHLWCTAPGCEDIPSDHGDVWRWFNKPVNVVLRIVLGRLQRAPQLVEVRQHGADIDILGEIDGEVLTDTDTFIPAKVFVPLATIFAGAEFDDVVEAHQDLIIAKWAPRKAA